MSDFLMIGASAHGKGKRHEEDFYATHPKALELFLPEIKISNVWECACGEGHLAEVLKKHFLLGKASDLIDRGYGETGIDFLRYHDQWNGDILTNPPYSDAKAFVQQALKIVPAGRYVIMLMRIQFLEGSRRKMFLQTQPPKYVYVSSSRLLMAKNGDFVKYNTPSANCYAWYVWEKGFTGETVVRYFN